MPPMAVNWLYVSPTIIICASNGGYALFVLCSIHNLCTEQSRPQLQFVPRSTLKVTTMSRRVALEIPS